MPGAWDPRSQGINVLELPPFTRDTRSSTASGLEISLSIIARSMQHPVLGTAQRAIPALPCAELLYGSARPRARNYGPSQGHSSNAAALEQPPPHARRYGEASASPEEAAAVGPVRPAKRWQGKSRQPTRCCVLEGTREWPH
jgi:hypothetical protein